MTTQCFMSFLGRFKAAVINIFFILIKCQMTVCKLKCVAHSDKHRIIIQLLSFPQLYRVFQHLSANCFIYTAHSFDVLVQSR